MSDEEIVSFLLQCKKAGMAYRDQFKSTWDEIELQVRCVLPDSYKLKDDWQTKVFIPMQAKDSEVAQAYLNKMVFGKTQNFDITGVEGDDLDDAQQLVTLISTAMINGGFQFENKFVMNEAVDIGTGWIKMTVDAKGDLKYVWVSAYKALVDPKCGHNLDKARFWVDQRERDISDILAEAKSGKGIYKKAIVGKFLAEASKELEALKGKGETGSKDVKEAMMVVKGIDGTNETPMEIPSKYSTVSIDEYYVDLPNKDGEYSKRIVSLLNDKHILRNDDNDWGFIPAQWCRIKPRKYEAYGKGYLESTRGLQELANSCINLGFDSLKISSMDIIVIDQSKVADASSIKYKPLAVWKMKDINAVKITRTPMSAISDILKGLTIIDQIKQDSTGVTRHAEGSPNLSGSGNSGETLGEYQAKLAAIDQRFLDVGRFIEIDYVVPLIRKTFRAIQNKDIFDQKKVNRILGMRTVDDGITEGGVFKKIGNKKIPKLDIAKIRAIDEMELDFKPVGVTQFADKLETLQKLKEALMACEQSPNLAAMTKVDILWKKLFQASEIQDYDEILKSKEEIQADMQKQNQPPPNKVSQSISFKDLPIDGQIQMAAEAGIKLDPNALMQERMQANQPAQPQGVGQ